MNIHRDTEYRFGELVQSPEYSNEQGVVVTIKSLATGQTMKVYLDEPTQEVVDGINLTYYEGHFYEEEFMVTSEGFEVTGLPLMYPYWEGLPSVNMIRVIDAENHYYSEKPTNFTGSINLVDFPISIHLIDIPFGETSSSQNVVEYNFTPFGGTSPGEGGGK